MAPLFNIGDKYDCWGPVGSPQQLSDCEYDDCQYDWRYGCENDDCVTFRNPANMQFESHHDDGTGSLLFFGVWSLLYVACTVSLVRYKKAPAGDTGDIVQPAVQGLPLAHITSDGGRDGEPQKGEPHVEGRIPMFFLTPS